MEQSVQYLELQSPEPDQPAVAETPVPMVERAFYLLNLLMVAQEGMGLSE